MPRKTVRILCFGDSLTQGFFSFGLGENPYSAKLAQRLHDDDDLRDVRFEMRTSGVPGDVAAFQRFRDRFNQQISVKPFDWVITLAGTNDIALGCRVDDTFKSLQSIWRTALARRCRVLAMTVPETGGNFPDIDEKRADLNKRILGFEAENYHAFDLHKMIPYKSLQPMHREKYWEADGVHLSEDGYDWMADHIADALIPLIREECQFEEEEDHPKDISRGYVVVRKTDLD